MPSAILSFLRTFRRRFVDDPELPSEPVGDINRFDGVSCLMRLDRGLPVTIVLKACQSGQMTADVVLKRVAAEDGRLFFDTLLPSLEQERRFYLDDIHALVSETGKTLSPYGLMDQIGVCRTELLLATKAWAHAS